MKNLLTVSSSAITLSLPPFLILLWCINLSKPHLIFAFFDSSILRFPPPLLPVPTALARARLGRFPKGRTPDKRRIRPVSCVPSLTTNDLPLTTDNSTSTRVCRIVSRSKPVSLRKVLLYGNNSLRKVLTHCGLQAWTKATSGRSKSLRTLIESDHYPDIAFGVKVADGNIGFSNNIYTIPHFCAFLLRQWLAQM